MRFLTAIVSAGAAVAALLPAPPAGAVSTQGLRVEGVVEQLVVDQAPGAAPTGAAELDVLTVVDVDGSLVPVPPGEVAALDDGDEVVLAVRAPDGMDREEAVEALAEGNGAVTVTDVADLTASSVEQPPVAATATAHRMVVVPAYWTSPDQATRSSLTALASDTAAYWNEQSRGKLSVTYEVRDWVRIAAPSGCNHTSILNAVTAATGITPSGPTEHLVVYFPRFTSCAWAGLGSISGSYVWINGYELIDVLAHEIGHNLGLGHANTATCTSGGTRVALSSSCSVAEYQDAADLMGYATYAASGSINGAFADHLGLIGTTTATATSGPVEVDLSPLSGPGANHAVKIATTLGDVFVDFRPAIGRDVRRPAWAGVQVHLRTRTSPPSTQLLDMQPASSFSAVALAAGASWAVPGTDLTVAVTSVGSVARVEVRGGGTAGGGDVTPPTAAVITAPLGGAIVTGPAVEVVWRASTDADAGLAGYTVVVDGATVASVGTGTLRHTLGSLAAGAHSARVDATDLAGNTRPGATVTFTVRDPLVAPRIVSPVQGEVVTEAAMTNRQVTLRWTAASAAASVQLVANGRVVRTVSGATSTRVSLAEGAYSLVVRALDARRAVIGTSAPVSFAVDVSAPSTPARLVMSAGDELAWRASTDRGTGVTTYVVSLDGAEVVRTTDPVAAVTSPEGVHTWSVVALDGAGHTSRSASVRVVRDASAPTTPVIVAPTTTPMTRVATTTVRWTPAADADTGISAYEVLVNGTVATRARGTATSVRVVLGQGPNVVAVRALNGGGTGATSSTVTVGVDSVGPTTPEALVLTAGGTLVWNPSEDAGTGVSHYAVTRDRASLGSTDTEVLATVLDEGRHTWTVVAVDAAGNRSATATLRTVRDSSAPVAPVVTSPTEGGFVASRTPVVTWRAAADRESGVSAYRVTVNGVAWPADLPSRTLSLRISVPAGSSTVAVAAVNGVGLVSEPTVVTFSVDSSAPTRAAVGIGAITGRTGRMVTARWSAAADPQSGVVGYRVVVGGRVVATTGPGAVRATFRLPSRGATAVVLAVNGAGLAKSSATIPIRRV